MFRLRMCNRFISIGFVIFLVAMIISFLMDSNLLNLIWNMKHATASIDGLSKAQVVQSYKLSIQDAWNANLLAEGAFMYTSIIFPLFASITCMHFIAEVNGYFPLAIHRAKHKSIFLWKGILTNSFASALALFLAFVLLFIVCSGFLTYRQNFSSTLFDSFFGKDFGLHHQILYIFADAFYKIFIFSFVYAIFTCGVYMESNSKVLALLVPVIYFFGFSLLFSNNYFLFAAFPFSITSYVGQTIFHGLLPLVVPLVLGILLNMKGIYKYGHK